MDAAPTMEATSPALDAAPTMDATSSSMPVVAPGTTVQIGTAVDSGELEGRTLARGSASGVLAGEEERGLAGGDRRFKLPWQPGRWGKKKKNQEREHILIAFFLFAATISLLVTKHHQSIQN